MTSFLHQAASIISAEIEGLSTVLQNLNESFNQAVQLLRQTKGRVIVTGVGKSGLIGRKISATLSSIGIPSFFLSPLDALHGDLGAVTTDDVVIMISNSGKTHELLELSPYIRQRDASIIAIIGTLQSPLAEAADVVLTTGVKHEACPHGVVPTTSTTATLVIGDALALCAAQAKGLGVFQFYHNHPQGSLGTKVKRIDQCRIKIAS
jgi:arabinose-5-phosphate isomerase